MPKKKQVAAPQLSIPALVSHTTQPLLISLPEAETLLGVSRPTLRKLIAAGLPTVRIGARLRIDPEALRKFVAERSVAR